MKNIHTSHQSMNCPRCNHGKTRVLNKRNYVTDIYRRRQCLNPKCGKRFTTLEKIRTNAN